MNTAFYDATLKEYQLCRIYKIHRRVASLCLIIALELHDFPPSRIVDEYVFQQLCKWDHRCLHYIETFVILSSRCNRIVTSNDACRKERGADKNVTTRSIIRGCFLAATKTALSTVRVLGTERPVADFALLLSRLSASYRFRYCVRSWFVKSSRHQLHLCSLIKKLSKFHKQKYAP